MNNVSENIKGSINILNLNFHHPVKELIWVLRRNDMYKRNQWNNYTTSLYKHNYHNPSESYGRSNSSNIITSSHIDNESKHSSKIYNIYNYLHGQESAFDNSFNKIESVIDSFEDENNFYNLNNDSFNSITNIMYNAKLMFNGNDRFSKKDNIFFNYLQPYKYHTTTPSEGVNVFTFALNPEENQPSGTCNMSRISNVQLELSLRWLKIKNLEDLDPAIYEGYECYVFALNYNILKILGGMGGLVFSN